MTNSANKKTYEDMTQEEKTKLEMKEQMLLQLHQQYAVNNNAKLSSAVTLIATLIAVIGAYGYVLLHINEGSFKPCINPEFNLLGLVLTAMTSVIVLAIIKHICMYQGFAQRRDQFIIYAIRCNNHLKINKDDEERYFPDNYHPFNKKGCEMYQGLFGEFILISCIVQGIILVSTIVVYLFSDYRNIGNMWAIFIFIVICGICCCVYRHQKDKDTLKYEKLCNIFMKYKVSQN